MSKKTAAEIEAHVREVLRVRGIDSHDSASAAKVLGLSVRVAVPVLKKLADEDFKADDGSSFVFFEGEARHRRGQAAGDNQPKRYIWFFT